ncbi:MAG: prepilin-type N-terminal cleavage/methylation domain-containing protein [Deltaproteobacteria bacterium]|nr:prepilin-type N-terminal cleavage/methylation domain-containing protein [Deltaproteobacteria bacterium]
MSIYCRADSMIAELIKIRNSHRYGFTLLEILISIAILSVILSVIYGTFHSSVRTIRSVQASSDLYRTARLILDKMSEDIRGSYIPSPGNPSETMKFGFIGEDHWDGEYPADTLNFTSTTHRLYESDRPQSIFSEIGYFLEKDEETGLKKLMRRESFVVDQEINAGGAVLEMGLRVQGLDLKYMDAEGSTWDVWDSTDSTAGEHSNSLPRIVEIYLLIAGQDDPPEQPPVEIATKVLLEMAQPRQ